MKVGDLVKHNPAKSTHPSMKKIYRDWGHEPAFKVGIVVAIETQLVSSENSSTVASVLSAKSSSTPAWYRHDELEVISEHR